MNFYKICLIFFLSLYIFGCTEKTIFSGKIITEEDLSNINITNKRELIEKFGEPSFKDDILGKYFYFTKKNKSKNFYNVKEEYSYLFVFELDTNDKIISSEVINLLNEETHKFNKNITTNNVVNRGLLEKIFGGIGPNQLPDSP